MNILQLPAIVNSPTIRKDKSMTLKFETREISPEEMTYLMTMMNTEGWLLFSQNEFTSPKELIPKESADVKVKSPSKRLYDVIYIMWIQQGKPGGEYYAYYKVVMEELIEEIKKRLV